MNASEGTPDTRRAVRKTNEKRVLAFAVGADDAIREYGGAVVRHHAHGDPVHLVIVGQSHMHANVEPLRTTEKEPDCFQQTAMTQMGFDAADVWQLPDAKLVYGEPLVQSIVDAIAAIDADLVYVPSLLENKPAPHALSMSVAEAVRRHGGALQLALPENSRPVQLANCTIDTSEQRLQKDDVLISLEQTPEQTLARAQDAPAPEPFFLISANALQLDHLPFFRRGHLHHASDAPLLAQPTIPVVSILIRSMDRPSLQDALDSLAFQTYSNLEVVVINANGGPHRPIGPRCGRFPMRVEGTGSALTRSVAANLGLQAARGEYILFLDDDDWLAPNHVSALVTAIASNSESKVAYAGVEVRGPTRDDIAARPFNDCFSHARLRWGNFIPIHAVLFARSALAYGIRFDEAFAVYEDWDFLLQLSEVSAFIHVDTLSAYYRASGTSGVGIHADPDTQRDAKNQIFDKWKHLWSGTHIVELVQSAVDVEKAQLARLNAALCEAHLEIDRAHGALNDKHAALEEAHTVLTQARASALALDDRLSALTRNASQLQEQLVHKVREIERLDGRLYDMLNSASWRLTAPIRYLSRRVQSTRRIALGGIPVLLTEMLERQAWPGGQPEVTQGFRGEEIVEPIADGTMPLVSVIMPVYNACRTDKRFFLRALESIANQTYRELELIVVDDGSTDESRDVFQAFMAQHPRLRAQYLTKENGGQSSARNFGVGACSGEYIGFLDQDDEWYADKLARVMPWLQNQDIDVLYTDADSIDGDDNVTHGNIHRHHFCGWPHPKKTIEDILFKDIFIMPGLMTIKKRAFDSIGGFDAKLSGYEDDDLFLRLYEKFNVFYLPIPTLRWRMYGDNYSFSHRMLTSRTYFWKKLLAGYGTTTFRTKMISLRFFAQFFSQAVAQFQAKSSLCWQSLAGAKEILPHLPLRQRAFFSLLFLVPEKYLLPYLARTKSARSN